MSSTYLKYLDEVINLQFKKELKPIDFVDNDEHKTQPFFTFFYVNKLLSTVSNAKTNLLKELESVDNISNLSDKEKKALYDICIKLSKELKYTSEELKKNYTKEFS